MKKIKVVTEQEKKEKAKKLFKFIDALTESPGFKALCEELGIYEDKSETTHDDDKDTWIGIIRLFYGFGGRL